MRHLSARALALYREGVIGPRRAARISAHLSGCPACSGVNSGLSAISRLLAGTPAVTMPQSVATRIQVAIAAESADRAARRGGYAEPGGTAAQRRRSSRARRPSWTSPVLLRGLAVTAAVVVVAGAGYLFATRAAGPSSTAGAPAAAPSARALHSGANVANGAATGGPVRIPYRLHSKSATGSAPVLTSDVNYTRRNLGTQVRNLVATTQLRAELGSPVPRASATYGLNQESGTVTGLLGGVRPAVLSGCLSQVAGAERVLAADVARYLGQRATIIVLMPLRASARVFDVVIVRLACSAGTPDVITRTTVPAG